ncbi:MAG: AI-2E family transporter [Candidatus Dormibacteria bacterium]
MAKDTTPEESGPAPRPDHTPSPAQRRQGVPETPEEHGRQPVSVRTLVVAAVIVLALLGTIAVLAQIFSLVLLFLIAIVFAEGIRPMVELLRRRGIHQLLSIVIVYVGLLAVLSFTVAILVQPLVEQATSLAKNLQDHQDQVKDVITQNEKRFNITNDTVQNYITNFVSQSSGVLLTISGYIVSILINLILVLVLGFLWLTTSARLKPFFVDLFPLRLQSLASSIIHEVGYRMGGYLRAVAINMVAVGVVTGIACALLGLPSPILLGVFAGVTAAVPLVGPFLGVVPPVLLGFTIGPTYPLVVLVILLLVQLADANIVIPRVMNAVVALPALAVILGLLIGGAVAGMVGALLAVPVASALQVIVLRVLVPLIHNAEGRTDTAYAAAYRPVSPALLDHAPTGGGRRSEPR